MSRTKQLFDEEREKDRHLDDAYLYDQSKLNRERESRDEDAITILTNFFNTLAESYGSPTPKSNED
jgi:hypothetical protein|tara:strand:+ start:1207 stop:1404 length:198 start_codon:yes stop_codon:yes gene_type:complete